MSIDLTNYCGTDPERPNILKPFSRGEWSYGTNGHILVRVPRDENIPEVADAPHAERVVPKNMATLQFRAVTLPTLPKYKMEECSLCNGESLHHCPDCTCKCPDCHGTGEVPERGQYVAIDGIGYALKYVLMLAKLPSLSVSDPAKDAPLPFRFDGGEGLLMPCRGTGPYVVKVKTK